jgi:hypothetical protein
LCDPKTKVIVTFQLFAKIVICKRWEASAPDKGKRSHKMIEYARKISEDDVNITTDTAAISDKTHRPAHFG